ncbi:hypothetical protein Leryth_016069, partial [Lithospermum erythrorhizon]
KVLLKYYSQSLPPQSLSNSRGRILKGGQGRGRGKGRGRDNVMASLASSYSAHLITFSLSRFVCGFMDCVIYNTRTRSDSISSQYFKSKSESIYFDHVIESDSFESRITRLTNNTKP